MRKRSILVHAKVFSRGNVGLSIGPRPIQVSFPLKIKRFAQELRLGWLLGRKGVGWLASPLRLCSGRGLLPRLGKDDGILKSRVLQRSLKGYRYIFGCSPQDVMNREDSIVMRSPSSVADACLVLRQAQDDGLRVNSRRVQTQKERWFPKPQLFSLPLCLPCPHHPPPLAPQAGTRRLRTSFSKWKKGVGSRPIRCATTARRCWNSRRPCRTNRGGT